MTRKEVCKAVGISVKTLRLYEEKGLIAPAKETRNGREYRDYSPELVYELERIVLLRRALFTMDEIRIMQTQPEKIPEIFHGYQNWLDQQVQQFQELRQAADSVREAALSSMDGLITELKSTASKMPLPTMDVKPNFRRIDELEEPPRHVEEQVNLDETIPSARVFRQVNLMMDRDKSNNINVAFGHVHDMLREKETGASGPVQRELKSPLWFKTLSVIATMLLLGAAILVLMDHRDGNHWIAMFVMTAIRVALAQLPSVLDHRKWSREHGKVSREEAARERKRHGRIAMICCLGLVVVAGLTYLLYRVVDEQVNPDRDYQVCFATPGYLSEKEVYAMEHVIEALVGDQDGNGKECTVVDYYQITPDMNYSMPVTSKDFRDWLQTGENWHEDGKTVLFFLANIEFEEFNICDDLNFQRYCLKLPEELQAGDNKYCADVTGNAMFEAVGLEELSVYACISKAATEEEYNYAVELLRKMLAQ